MRSSVDPRPVLIGAIAALLAALTAAGVALPEMGPEQLAPSLWRGYHTLLAAPSERLGAFAEALARSPGIDALVSRYTSPASFNTFDGFASVPVARLAGRLDPQDPRFDPYLRGLEGYFWSGGVKPREVMYIRCAEGTARLIRRLARLPEARGLSLQLLEAGPAAALRLGLLCVFLALLLARQRGLRLRLASAAAALPWVPVAYLGSELSLLAALGVLPLWAAILGSAEPFLRGRLLAPSDGRRSLGGGTTRSARGRFWLRIPPLLVAIVALLVLLKRAGQPLGAIFLAAASGVLAVPLLYASLALELVSCAHLPFLPVRILAVPPWLEPGRRAKRTLALLMIGVAMLALPAHAALSRLRPLIVPAPGRQGLEGAGLSWASLQALSGATAGVGLPDLADFLTHRAYQEGLAFGRRYVFPTLGERVVIPSFARDPGGRAVVRADRVVLRYPDAWLDRTLASAPPGSVARLLADQGQALAVDHRSVGVPPLEASTVALHLCLALLLGLALLGDGYDLTASTLCANRGLALGRRRQAV